MNQKSNPAAIAKLRRGKLPGRKMASRKKACYIHESGTGHQS
jgi:hypothetical protein